MSDIRPGGKGSHSASVLGKLLGFTSYKNLKQIIDKAEKILEEADAAIEAYLEGKDGLKAQIAAMDLNTYRGTLPEKTIPAGGSTFPEGQELAAAIEKQWKDIEDCDRCVAEIVAGDGDPLDADDGSDGGGGGTAG